MCLMFDSATIADEKPSKKKSSPNKNLLTTRIIKDLLQNYHSSMTMIGKKNIKEDSYKINEDSNKLLLCPELSEFKKIYIPDIKKLDLAALSKSIHLHTNNIGDDDGSAIDHIFESTENKVGEENNAHEIQNSQYSDVGAGVEPMNDNLKNFNFEINNDLQPDINIAFNVNIYNVNTLFKIKI